MKGITIPDSVTNIGSNTFNSCTQLTSVTIGNGVTTLETGTFSNTGLASITIPNNVTSIGSDAFWTCYSLTNLTIGNSVTNIGNYAFFDCLNLKSVTIPNSVTSIGSYAFEHCSSLTSVIIGNVVSNIGSYAFAYCTYLTSITVPNSVTSIGTGAFQYCYTTLTTLASIYFQGNAPASGSDSSVFLADSSATIYYLPGATGWHSPFDGRPAILWNPQAQTGDSSFGVRTNRFGFTITGTTNIPIVVEACTNLASPVWNSLTNVMLTNGPFYFSDAQWTNYPARYYRFRSP
jgi:hypothetical protein